MDTMKTQHVAIPAFNLKSSISQAVNEMRAASEMAAAKVLDETRKAEVDHERP
jgi:hypothetical protein